MSGQLSQYRYLPHVLHKAGLYWCRILLTSVPRQPPHPGYFSRVLTCEHSLTILATMKLRMASLAIVFAISLFAPAVSQAPSPGNGEHSLRLQDLLNY